MSDSAVQIKIPEELVTNMVRAEMVKQLGGLEEVAKQVVIAAMDEPATDRYGSETYKWVDGKRFRVTRFETRVNEMLQKEAEAVFQAWIDTHREALNKALMGYLTKNKNKVLKSLCESMVNGLTSFRVHATLSLKPAEEG
jgi:hypothetical protein